TRAGRPRNQDTNPAEPADPLSRKKFDGRCRSGTDIMLTGNAEKNESDRTKNRPRQARPTRPNGTPEKTRYIPARTRDAVFVRDKNRCTHIGKNGKRCNETRWLQIDHIVPFAKGGTSVLSNLRLLCAEHNKLEAKRAFGAVKIDRHCRRE
ncbi:MAG: HNH endonuclease signature motif containing protein, partial [bacterium]